MSTRAPGIAPLRQRLADAAERCRDNPQTADLAELLDELVAATSPAGTPTSGTETIPAESAVGQIAALGRPGPGWAIVSVDETSYQVANGNQQPHKGTIRVWSAPPTEQDEHQ